MSKWLILSYLVPTAWTGEVLDVEKNPRKSGACLGVPKGGANESPLRHH